MSELRAKWATRAALIIAVSALLVSFVFYIGLAHKAVLFPYGLDYGEGIVWQQMRDIVAGRGYGPVGVFPAIVFHYPPLYHLLTAGFADLFGLDQLAAGRLLSILSTIATGGVIGLIVARLTPTEDSRAAAWICGSIAGLIIFGMMPVLYWSRFMRVDMVSTLFSFAGVYFGLRALDRPGPVVIAALCFVAAIYTKQTAVAAPIAVFATLSVLRPRTAIVGIVTGLCAALIALAALMWQTNGGFLRHIVLYNINRLEMERLFVIVIMVAHHALYVGVALIGIVHHARHRLPDYGDCRGLRDVRRRLVANLPDSQYLMILAYLIFATLMLITVAKSGASYNYYIEWLCVIATFTGLALRESASDAARRDISLPVGIKILLPAAIAVQACLLWKTPEDMRWMSATHRAELAKMSAIVRSAKKPVISDDMVMLLRSGRTVQWEPAIFAELASTGVWNEQPMIAKIRHEDFAFFATEDDFFDSRFTPAMADAMAQAYPVKRRLSGLTLHFPATTPGKLLADGL